MSFLQAIFLLGTLAVAGPLIAHFFAQPRFKKIPFTMLRFLQVGHKETQARRRLKDFLLLALRMLIIVVIAVAFAGPRLVSTPEDTSTSPIHVIGIDDSLSMAYQDGTQTYLQKAQERATEYLRQAPQRDRFAIYGLASDTTTQIVEKEEAAAFVTALKPVPAPIDPSPWFAALEKAVSAPEDKDIDVNAVLISDFTPAALATLQAPRNPIPVREATIVRVASNSAIRNAAIEDCAVEELKKGSFNLRVKIANSGDDDVRETVIVASDKQTLATQEVAVPARQRGTTAIELALPPADTTIPLTVTLNNKDGLAEDNTYCLGLALPERIESHVLLVADNPRNTFLLKTALAVLSDASGYEGFETSTATADTFDPRILTAVSAVAFADRLPRLEGSQEAFDAFFNRGGRVIVFAPYSGSLDSLRAWYDAGFSPVTVADFDKSGTHIAAQPGGGRSGDALDPGGAVLSALRNYDLSKVLLTGYYPVAPAPGAQVLWSLENEVPFVAIQPRSRGGVVYVNTSADDHLGALMKSPAALAFCKYLVGHHQTQRVYAFSADQSVSIPATELEMQYADGDDLDWIMLPDGTQSDVTVADGFLLMHAPLQLGMAATVSTPTRYAGLNVPAGETDMALPATTIGDTLAERFFLTGKDAATARAGLATDTGYQPLWNYFLWAAVLLILAEAFVANRVKR